MIKSALTAALLSLTFIGFAACDTTRLLAGTPSLLKTGSPVITTSDSGLVSIELQSGQTTPEKPGNSGQAPPEYSANLLYIKPATQSSTEGRNEAGKANSGLFRGCVWSDNFDNNHVSITTSGEIEPWWNGDILLISDVDQVRVYPRTDNNLEKYTVRVGNSSNPKNNPACPGTYTGQQNVTCNLRGRYVGVVLQQSNVALHLCEVEAYTQLNKGSNKRIPAIKAHQTTTDGNINGAEIAIDGKYNCRTSFTQTHQSNDPNWVAHLDGIHFIKYVSIHNAEHDLGFRLDNYEVRVGMNPDPWQNPTCAVENNQQQFKYSQVVQCNLFGKYYAIQVREAKDILTLCEVTAYE